MLGYLASPYNSSDDAVKTARLQEAKRCTAMLLGLGAFVFSPIVHNVSALEGSALEAGWQHWKHYDLMMLGRCDYLLVLLLDGWPTSEGVRAEIDEATRLDMPIRYIAPVDLDSAGDIWLNLRDFLHRPRG